MTTEARYSPQFKTWQAPRLRLIQDAIRAGYNFRQIALMLQSGEVAR